MEFLRSLMFVPGHRQRFLDKVQTLPLDVALFDLEDGVPSSEKQTARRFVAETLGRPPGGPIRFVRINAVGSDRMTQDLEAVLRPGLQGLLLPKVERPDEVQLVDKIVTAHEATGDGVKFIAAIESANGLLNAPAIAKASPRVIGLVFGAEDFALDIGLTTKRVAEAAELLYARSAIVVAAAAARVESFDGVWADIQDSEGLRRDCLQARRLGFSGKSLIHPGHIETINEIFSPTAGDVDYARRVVQAFEDAQARGEGAIAFGGQMIDLPIVERARRVLRAHEALAPAK